MRWGRTVLTGVHWMERAGTATDTTGRSAGTAESVLIIPEREDYVSPTEYDGSAGWTLQPGDGIIEGEGPGGDISGPIQKAVPGCKLIAGWTAHRYGSSMDNWEVTAK